MPSSTKRFAVAKPIPVDAPVITAIFPANFVVIDLPSFLSDLLPTYGFRTSKRRPRRVIRSIPHRNQSMDRLRDMEVFARVVETGSFSAAARDLNLGQPAVSKTVAALGTPYGGLKQKTPGFMPCTAGSMRSTYSGSSVRTSCCAMTIDFSCDGPVS